MMLPHKTQRDSLSIRLDGRSVDWALRQLKDAASSHLKEHVARGTYQSPAVRRKVKSFKARTRRAV
jgi:ribosomal protein S21